jgi:2-dehydro-3-deoxygluconokinase
VTEACRRAKEQGLAISFDVNYRARLWSAREASTCIRKLIAGVELLFCSARDAATLFDFTGSPESVLAALADLSGARRIVLTLGAEGIAAFDGQENYRLPARAVTIVDRIGAGDALAAGVLRGWLRGDFAAGLRYGVTLAALALSQHGDAVVVNERELEALAAAPGADLIR